MEWNLRSAVYSAKRNIYELEYEDLSDEIKMPRSALSLGMGKKIRRKHVFVKTKRQEGVSGQLASPA